MTVTGSRASSTKGRATAQPAFSEWKGVRWMTPATSSTRANPCHGAEPAMDLPTIMLVSARGLAEGAGDAENPDQEAPMRSLIFLSLVALCWLSVVLVCPPRRSIRAGMRKLDRTRLQSLRRAPAPSGGTTTALPPAHTRS